MQAYFKSDAHYLIDLDRGHRRRNLITFSCVEVFATQIIHVKIQFCLKIFAYSESMITHASHFMKKFFGSSEIYP